MKVIFSISVVLLPFISCFAQTEGIGLRGGLALSNTVSKNISSSTTSSSSYKASYTAGVFYDSEIQEKLYGQVGIDYSNKGYKSGSRSQGNLNRIDLHYLNLITQLKYYAINNLFITAGGNFGVLTSAKWVWDYDNSSTIFVNTAGSAKINDRYHRLDAGINIGFGYQFNENISFNIRYNMGLVNTYDPYFDDPTINGNSTRVMNRTTDIVIAYKL